MPHFAPGVKGNGRRAWARAASAVTFPLTVTAATDDQFNYASAEFIVPASASQPGGTYANVNDLADALNKCTNDEDNAGVKLHTLVVFEVSRSDGTKLVARSLVPGVNVSTFATGAEHDGLVTATGFSNGQALADGDPVD